ncbi:hypothetical protein SAMN05192550_0633 [Flavobacterium glycines]|uniref:LlaJI family restriction endonuclease n=1 Tax=Flavobacterium glycines TaxID=551990 RepID=A0A1B9DNQ7_9FLAO|nr:hypothetical protein [Flavobacterium glycines]OCB71320.1 hypothetical protein FBGL_08725 [Flavobacterium glycines]GEL10334.1 hypothetical protein FGL01_10730 [Flavobacterium glycines]SDI71998.1 hypothetical protein SAMN05192550_0633 [Flavobacterium glycines]
MKILIENEIYPIDLLEEVFDDPKFYKQNGLEGTITSVGYYHSFEKNSLVFMLPKVFMAENKETVFDCSKEELVDLIDNESVKHKTQYNWVRQLSIHFYNSLTEFRKRYNQTSIIHNSETFELNTNLGDKEYSFLDLLLSFVNFYKKNKQQILFKHIEFVSNQAKKPKWEKTIRKSMPIVTNGKTPIYVEITNKKKIINTEEELLTYFFSILNHLNKEHKLNLKIDKSFSFITGKLFDNLCQNGSVKLRKIKHRYFNDTLKRMYVLCEMYFAQFDKSSGKRKREDFLAISNYNLVFEDMVDKLFSDKLNTLEVDGITIDKLKNNDDGKIIDHIYDYKSLIDTSNIFYIGDSKYYKSDSTAGKVSKYKQFTYAKNVIQFNIDLLNKKGQQHLGNLRYRDKLTEGYNISPNFFIYGYIDDIDNYDNHVIKKKGKPVPSYHFQERLFDRDTLFVHQYKINFLYVLKAYTHFNEFEIQVFRDEVKNRFRKHFLKFFNNQEACGFEFYESNLKTEDYQTFVEENFKKLNGKCFCTIDNKLLLAKHNDDNELDTVLQYFQKIDKLK